MDLHPVGAAFREAVIPLLVTFRGLVHVRIPLPFFVFGGTRRGDQGGVHARALAHRHAFLIEAEGEDRGLIRDPVADQLDAGKAAYGKHLDQGFFHRRIAQGIPQLQQVKAQQLLRRSLRLRCQGYGGRPPFLLALEEWGSIKAMRARQGTSASISKKNFSHLICFLAVVSS